MCKNSCVFGLKLVYVATLYHRLQKDVKERILEKVYQAFSLTSVAAKINKNKYIIVF